MELSPDSIAEFQRLYEAHCGVRLSETEARIKATQLIELVEVVYSLDSPSAVVAGYRKKDPSDGDHQISH